jgi:hypothetical protein
MCTGASLCRTLLNKTQCTEVQYTQFTPMDAHAHSTHAHGASAHLSLPPEGVAHAVGPVVEALGGADQQVTGVEVRISLQNRYVEACESTNERTNVAQRQRLHIWW